ncbi:Protein CBG24957 [Caenorhabditis briggsae]|uniref:Protein CBG24957 n=1 Tax=Caenorhabditis briggsae TaxID=6238 RepID=A8WLU6_CAEBR|nr:Protein CBG24957 [Caenorhabditis briggsae]CAP21443.2 Protein CBG24957 [Caenorhabditis briggsae]
MMALGEVVAKMTTVDVIKPAGDHRGSQILQNGIKQLENLKKQMGKFARETIFGSVMKLARAMFGVSESTLTKAKQFLSKAKDRHVDTRKLRNSTALKHLSEEEKQIILDHIDKCHGRRCKFLHLNAPRRFGAPLRALRLSFKLKQYNPFATIRKDIIEWRRKYLKLMDKLILEGAFICYYDETWIFHGMTKIRGWNHVDTNPYLITHWGNLNNPRPGFPAASDKGQRAIVLAVTTESQILPESIDIVVSKRPDSEVLVDYHQYINSEMYKKYMMKVLPMIVKATPAGREAVLVIDNASIHNSVVEKIPTKNSSKQELLTFLSTRGISSSVIASKNDLWIEVQDFFKRNGGRKELMRYEVDEYAASLGVTLPLSVLTNLSVLTSTIGRACTKGEKIGGSLNMRKQ